eukprot:TRINITY_DN41351_c0_g1_i1.p2 TRINITY_DN41351_c0_g1~~TRINITY_DN41351_c0_g1_i1.p2  ORF type:complete len:170 (+),score=4.99 TRINITY_DN41351_c0_g1_i1:126-635(+)
MPNKRNKPLEIPLINHTNGLSSFCSGRNKKELGKAIFSGQSTASVFGVISAKIKITKVSTPVAIAIPASPNKRCPTMVANAEAIMLTRLLPIKIKPINLSGLLSSFSTRSATLFLSFARWRKRQRLSDIMLVSELEKQAEITIKITSAISRALVGMSFKIVSFYISQHL